MKKTMKFFSIAALALVGAVMTSCSSSDDLTENTQQPQPASGSKVETFTTTVSLDGSETRALDGSGHKTFAEGETMALIYKNTSGNTVKAVSEELTAENIAEGSQSATFTFTLDNPDKTQGVMYIYPAAMATETASINYNALYTQQDGTLTKLASNFDFCLNVGYWSDGNLPSLALENHLAILALTLKNDADGSNITNSITGLTVSDGSHTYNVTRETGDGPIYVAIIETDSKTIEVTATDGTKTYAKALSNKSYEHNNGYNFSWRMAEVIKGKFSVSSTKQVYFSKGNLQATTSNNGGTWQWHFGPTQYARVGNGTANTDINGNGSVKGSGNGKNIDLFGWSTSDTHLGINNSTNNNDYRTGSVTDGSDFVDWGSAKEVTDCIGTGWRTLTSDEWRYLMVTRTGNKYAKAQINGSRSGFIILPDGWTNTTPHTLNNINNASAAFTSNAITSADWTNKYEKYGAVFLPVTGQRNSGTTVNGADEQLHYWSSSGGINDSKAPIGYHLRYLDSGDQKGLAPDTGAGRCNGFSVRLVRDVK